MSALAKLTWIEIKLFLRDPVAVVFALVLPVIFLFVLAEVFGGPRRAASTAASGRSTSTCPPTSASPWPLSG